MKNNKMLAYLLIVVVVITLLGALLYIIFFALPKAESGAGKEPSIDQVLESSVDIPEITTNLAERKFIRISLKVQTDSKDGAKELTKRDFQVKNMLINSLSEMSEDDLRGKKGKLQLESALKSQINRVMQEGKVQQVYITSYIIQ